MESFSVAHNSRDVAYRFPVGAVEAESEVWLGVKITGVSEAIDEAGDEAESAANVRYTVKDGAASGALRLWQEGVGETRVPLVMSLDERTGDVWLGASITVPDAGTLVWYYFELNVRGKSFYYGNNAECLGGLGAISSAPPASFQITVYDHGADTPSWFRHAMMYQIFPDRFCRVGEHVPEKRGAVVHASWHDAAQYYKDEVSTEILAYDFFGGNLAGIRSKLDYLKSLGVSVIYLNPVFESESNHHYDTGDYKKIDPMLGDESEFRALAADARAKGIRIILDGVFSHTGANSVYFNKRGAYDSLGAYQSKSSPYYKWYDFSDYPDKYSCWWNFDTLPDVHETEPSYMDFIINDDDSVLHHWMRAGIAGWRLDVIDELPPKFSQSFYREMKRTDKDAVLIGEVWEDASNKVAYSKQREYLAGHEIDGAMNYPFRSAVIDFLLGHIDGEGLWQRLESLRENYPAHNYYAMMNLLGSHDVERIMTVLGEAPSAEGMSQGQKADYRLNESQARLARRRVLMAMLWQMMMPGVPSIYYGDEIGMQGFRDPYNRGPYDWDGGDDDLRQRTREAARLRNEHTALSTGEYIPLMGEGDVFSFARVVRGGKDVFGDNAHDEAFVFAMNRNAKEAHHVRLGVGDFAAGTMSIVMTSCDETDGGKISQQIFDIFDGAIEVDIPSLTAMLLRVNDEANGASFTRRAGLLLHPTSFPSVHGIGDIGRGAYEFVDFLASAGMSVWQILPLAPVADDGSPYASPSAFAGNELLISLESLAEDEHLLTAEEAETPIEMTAGVHDFGAIRRHKDALLLKAYERFRASQDSAYDDFCEREHDWLDDYALFMAIHKEQKERAWYEWPLALRQRDEDAMDDARGRLSREIGFVKFKQYIFDKQWSALHEYARERGIKILGDMPLFVSPDSADVWCHQELFALGADGRATKVAGVPPDYFSKTGQLWGNPQYDWDAMKRDDYRWWTERMRTLLSHVDMVRMDHFRGIESYWEIDGGEETAVNGRWVKGPGMALFRAMSDALGELPIVAEDLGVMTPAVKALREEAGFPGMSVLEFELIGNGTPRAGFTSPVNAVAYTGTHDNNTVVGWYEEDISVADRARVLACLGLAHDATSADVARAMVTLCLNSRARLAIVPIQDVLALGADSRMNRPGTVGGNWSFTMKRGALTRELAERLSWLVRETGRGK